jgi:hypothetical protein
MSDLQILESDCEWLTADVADESLWTEMFSGAELDELDAALRHALAVSEDVLDIGRDHFPLPALSKRLATIEHELMGGRGFVRLRGVDRSRYSQSEMEMIYWGVGTHLGTPWAQNKHGHVLGDVTDQYKKMSDPTVRGNEIGGAALPFHCDGSDLVGLMCLQNGIAGGLSTIANSVSIHNRMVRERPELAAELYKSQPYDHRGEQAPGRPGWYSVPVFTEWEGRLFVRCIPPYIYASQRHDDAPRLTPLAREALTMLEEIANDPRHHVAMELRPGDMQFINNFHVLHGRTAYEDNKAGGAVRHLKRLWLETAVLASRPPYFENSHQHHWDKRRSVSRIQTAQLH